jgi:NAD(P)-dependent dehydrogenase (short-subunit alcohol dehydrogenase family)
MPRSGSIPESSSGKKETAMLPEGTFEGKVCVITGGGSGMGRAIALEFARLGAAVVVAGRREDPLAQTVTLVEGQGGRALPRPTDVRDPTQVEDLVAASVERFGRLDVLVNSAAGNFVVKAEELSPNGWRAVVSIVLDGGFLCSRAAARQMIEQRQGGAILSVLASYAWTGGPGTVHSAAAKAGLLAMTRTLAVEWGGYGIRANCITPGPTDTEGAGAALWPTLETRDAITTRVPLGRFATVEEIAWWSTALCSPFASFITGADLVIDGGHWLEQEGYMPALGKARRP